MEIIKPEDVGISSIRLKRLINAMQGYIDRKELSGLITLIARRGKVAHFECYGMMDIEAQKPMKPDTIFRIYSMTKPITSVALMMLHEEGRFILNDLVSKFIPEFENMKVFVNKTETGIEFTDLQQEITVWNLLTHTSGLGYGFGGSFIEDLYLTEGIFSPIGILQVPLQEMVEKITKLPLANQPGEIWGYSIATDIIGYLVSIISDMPFDAFLEERIFKPLGMDDTSFYVPKDKLNRFSAMYGNDLKLMDAPTESPFLKKDYNPSGGGGIVSTTSDYLRFAQMLLNNGELDGVRLLGRKTVEYMTTNHLSDGLVNMFGNGFGLGFAVGLDDVHCGCWGYKGSYGWLGAAGTIFQNDPKEELICFLMPQNREINFPIHPTFLNLVYQAIID